MGSCINKYQIPENPRFFAGQLGESIKIPAQKYKSVSSKKYAGTNTFEDIVHENQPVPGDIYYHFNSSKAYRARTVPSLPPPPDEVRIQYGLNPYELKQQAYHRSRTQNINPQRPGHNHFQSQNVSHKPQLGFSRKPSAQVQNGSNPQNQVNYSKLFGHDDQEPNIRMTESRML